MIRKDEDGNIIGCKHCGSRQLRKDGWQYWKTLKRQRWKCTSCFKKFITPKIIEKPQFEKELEEVDFIPIDEIIEHRKKQYNQKLKAKKSKRLINIKINK